MSSTANLFVRAGQPPADVARLLASVLGADVRVDADLVRVFRPGVEAEIVGGEVDTNRYGAPPDPEPDEFSVLDGYDTVFTVRSVPRGDDLLLREGRAIFDIVVERLPWPALLLWNMSILVVAWNPAIGLTEFPPGTTPDMRHKQLWAPYDLPAFDPNT
jgi:hypothetical protein